MLGTLSPDDPHPGPAQKDVNNAETALGLRNSPPGPGTVLGVVAVTGGPCWAIAACLLFPPGTA